MAKKKDTEEVEFVEVQKEVVIHPLTLDMGREDLNTMVKKVNEIIHYLNNK